MKNQQEINRICQLFSSRDRENRELGLVLIQSKFDIDFFYYTKNLTSTKVLQIGPYDNKSRLVSWSFKWLLMNTTDGWFIYNSISIINQVLQILYNNETTVPGR